MSYVPYPMSAVDVSPIAPGGFEPPFCGPKPHVLPLDEGADVLAASLQSYFRTSTWTTRSLVRVTITDASRASVRESGAAPSKTPNTVDPEPESRANPAPAVPNFSRNSRNLGYRGSSA